MKSIARDDQGNTYSSIAEMCRARNVDYSTFLHRFDAGWSLSESLHGRPRKGKKIIYKGVEYCSIHQFCKILDIKYNYVKKRLKKGMTIHTIVKKYKR